MVVQKQVSVGQEVDTLMQLVVKLVSDVKAQKSVPEIMSDMLPPFVAALTSLSQLGEEIKQRGIVERTLALGLCDVVDAVL